MQRESYYGQWLPEPVLTGNGQLGPLETVEQRESVSMATMRIMEQLTPPERAVFLLRSAFDVPYPEIAQILEISVESARQLMHRAQDRVRQGATRFEADSTQHAELFARFMTATATGDLAGLEELLAEHVVAYSDGGGKVKAAPLPIFGASKVMRFAAALLQKSAVSGIRMVEANGYPAAFLLLDEHGEQLISISVRDGQITEIFSVMNPGKLSYLGSHGVR